MKIEIITDTKEIQQIIRTQPQKFKVDQFPEIYGLPVLDQNQTNYLSIILNINRQKLKLPGCPSTKEKQ